MPEVLIRAGQALVLAAELHHQPLCLRQLLRQFLGRHTHLIAAADAWQACGPSIGGWHVPVEAHVPQSAWLLLTKPDSDQPCFQLIAGNMSYT